MNYEILLIWNHLTMQYKSSVFKIKCYVPLNYVLHCARIILVFVFNVAMKCSNASIETRNIVLDIL